jgi:DNA-binding CsgD family transcriptional regulator
MKPAGIKIGETEFFTDENGNISAMHQGCRKEIYQLPAIIHDLIDVAMDETQKESLNKMGVFMPLDRRLQFLKCNCSTYDETPDLVNGTFRNEYVECSQRQKCAYEGKLCKPITLSNGTHLTMAELRITSLIRAGQFDKEIARAVGIKENTLRKHKQNIQEKLNVDSKTQIALKAIELGIA